MADDAETPDLSSVTYDALLKRHPERSYWDQILYNYRLLYRGGEEFIRSAGQVANVARTNQATATTTSAVLDPKARRRRFLFQLEGEPNVKYEARWERCFYIGYVGAIIDYFRHWLFSQPPVIRPVDDGGSKESPEPPDWWDAFYKDVGGGKNLIDFCRDVFLDVLVVRQAGWLIGTPSLDVGGMSQAEADEADVSGVVLTPYAAEEIIDWEVDDSDELKWVVLRKSRHIRQFPNDRAQVEVYTYVDRDSWQAWQVVHEDGKEQSLEIVGKGDHGLGEVPFVRLEVPHGLWPMNKLASWQIDLFNKMSMLSYGQLVSCFLQPFLKTNELGAEARVFGEGVLLNLRAGGGDQPGEEFGWAAAPVAPLEFTAAQLKEQRDEGYRIVHQMALAVDSQAIGAIARSGASKIEDRKAAEIILAGFGGYVRDSLVRTANLISKIQGDDTEWSCDGFDNFQVSSLEEELQTAALVQTFSIKSPTFNKEMQINIATGRVLSHLDEATKNKIRDEISDAVDEEEEQKLAPQLDPLTGQLLGTIAPHLPALPAVEPGKNGMPPKPPVDKPPKPPGPNPLAKGS